SLGQSSRTKSVVPEPGNERAPLSRPAESRPLSASISNNDFFPHAPKTVEEAKINNSAIEELICKYLLARGECTIRDTTQQIRLPFALCQHVVQSMKQDQVIGYVGQTHANDYICKLSEVGRERAKRFSDICSYFGSAPVSYQCYIDS